MAHECIIHTCPALIQIHRTVPNAWIHFALIHANTQSQEIVAVCVVFCQSHQHIMLSLIVVAFLKKSITLKVNDLAYERIFLVSCEWVHLSVSLCCVVLIEYALYKIHPTTSCSVCLCSCCFSSPKPWNCWGWRWVLISSRLLFGRSFTVPLSCLQHSSLIMCWVYSHSRGFFQPNSL